MLTMNEDLGGALASFVQAMEQKRYFEAHEILEEAWHPLRIRKDRMALLLKGMINGAIALEHLKRATPNAQIKAERVVEAYYRYKPLLQEATHYQKAFKEAMQTIDAHLIQSGLANT